MTNAQNRLGFIAFCPDTMESPFILGLPDDGELRGSDGDSNMWLVPHNLEAKIIAEEISMTGNVGLYIMALKEEKSGEIFLNIDVVDFKGRPVVTASIVSLDKMVQASYELAGRGYRNGLKSLEEALDNGETVNNDGDALTALDQLVSNCFDRLIEEEFRSYVQADDHVFLKLCSLIRTATHPFITNQNARIRQGTMNAPTTSPLPPSPL